MLFIDLDREEKIPKITVFQGPINIKKNGRIIVRNSALEDIDTISVQDLEYILKNFKQYISPILTSGYIPNENVIKATIDYQSYKSAQEKALPKFKYYSQCMTELKKILDEEIKPLISAV